MPTEQEIEDNLFEVILETIEELIFKEIVDLENEKDIVCGLYAGCIVCGLRAVGSKFEYPVEFDFPIQLTGKPPVEETEKPEGEEVENLPMVESEKGSKNLEVFSFENDLPSTSVP